MKKRIIRILKRIWDKENHRRFGWKLKKFLPNKLHDKYIYWVGDFKKWLESGDFPWFSELLKAEKKRAELVKRRQYEWCQHIAGSSPLSCAIDPYERTSIVWHHTGAAGWVGICLVCQRQFAPSDSDFGFWFAKTSYSKPSASGAHKTTHAPKEFPKYDLTGHDDGMEATPPDEFSVMTDKELHDTYQAALAYVKQERENAPSKP